MVQYQTNACKIVQFKITWTLVLIERSTLVDSVLWNHSRPSAAVRLSLRLSYVCPLLSFHKIGLLVFFWYCTWRYLAMISRDWRSQIFEKKKKLAARIWAKRAKIRPKTSSPFFSLYHFLKFSSLVFLEFTIYNDSLQQCLTSSRSKIHKKKIWGTNLGQRSQNQTQN